MDFLDPFLGFLADVEFAIPVSQVGTLLVLNSLCLLFGKHKLGLLVSYSFVFYWGFIFNRVHFVSAFGENLIGLYVYAVTGIFMLLLALLGFLREPG